MYPEKFTPPRLDKFSFNGFSVFSKLHLIIITGLVCLLAISGTIPAKDYRIERIDIQAQILDDGSLQIQESRTYTFSGSFSWADYRVPLTAIGEIQQFTVDESGNLFRQNDSQEAGTYFTSREGDDFYARWHYRAENETRTFTLRYLVTGAVIRYLDVAEFYYKFVGESNLKQIGSVQATLEFPHPASFPEVRAWAHGPLWGEVRFREGDIDLAIQPLPPGQFWEARVVFPGEWVPDARRSVSENRLPQILREEDQWARAANEQRIKAEQELQQREARESRGWQLAAVLGILVLGMVAGMYLKFGRGHPVNYYEKISSELPENEPPAVTSALYFYKNVYGAAMTATLFDLARRGYLEIRQIAAGEQKWWGKTKPRFALQSTPGAKKFPGDNLRDYESNLLDFVFNELGEGRDQVELTLFKKKSSKVQRWFRKWKVMLRDQFKDLPYYDKSSVRGTVITAIIGAVTTGLGVLVLITMGIPGIVLVILGVLTLALSFTILRFTPEIKLRRKKLDALKTYLKKYHFLDSGQSQFWPQNIEKYLIYGLALGIGNKAIEKMLASVTPDQHATYFPWYHVPPGSYTSPADFSHAISTMVSIASSTVSSSTGSGGGASGGGGGGGGGASGGAG